MKINFANMLKEAGLSPEFFLNELFRAVEKLLSPSEKEYWLVRYDLTKVKSVHRLWESKEAREEVFPFGSYEAALKELEFALSKNENGIYRYDIEEATAPEIEEEGQHACPSHSGEDEEADIDPEEFDQRVMIAKKDFFEAFLKDFTRAPTSEELFVWMQAWEGAVMDISNVIAAGMRERAKQKPKN